MFVDDTGGGDLDFGRRLRALGHTIVLDTRTRASLNRDFVAHVHERHGARLAAACLVIGCFDQAACAAGATVALDGHVARARST